MRPDRFVVFAWATLAYNLAVVAWGAFVRASGSGAGCGSHWPLCNGQVVPLGAQTATLVEFTHRITSGIALLLVVALVVWAWRLFPRGHAARFGAAVAMAFMISEALVGAGLVLLGLVADNSSMARAVVLGIHLVNTFFLLAFIALTAWWGSGRPRARVRGGGLVAVLLVLAGTGTLVVGVAGAITALGDTLFPVSSLADGVRQDFSATAHFLVRLRVIHPLLAIGLGLYMLVVAGVVRLRRRDPATRRLASLLILLFFVQLGIGTLNVALMAPIWMQLVHLLMADLVWLTLVLLGAAALSVAPAAEFAESTARPLVGPRPIDRPPSSPAAATVTR
ncbi:MAG: COX15/CtaA family protein [Gemmatimonadaceae bacterium]